MKRSRSIIVLKLGVLALGLILLRPTHAADDPQTAIAALNAAVVDCQQQVAEGRDARLQKVVAMQAEIERLRKRVAELEDAAKGKK